MSSLSLGSTILSFLFSDQKKRVKPLRGESPSSSNLDLHTSIRTFLVNTNADVGERMHLWPANILGTFLHGGRCEKKVLPAFGNRFCCCFMFSFTVIRCQTISYTIIMYTRAIQDFSRWFDYCLAFVMTDEIVATKRCTLMMVAIVMMVAAAAATLMSHWFLRDFCSLWGERKMIWLKNLPPSVDV